MSGSGLPWKVATWGSHNDVKMLRRVSRIFQSLGDMQSSHELVISEGPELRKSPVTKGEYSTVYTEELVGKQTINTLAMARYRHTFSFPDRVLIENRKYHISQRAGVKKKLFICRGPNVIVGAARTFAVFNKHFFVVPARQIGIRCKLENDDLLQALSLYLSSDFAFYHQFFTASQFGVKASGKIKLTCRDLYDGLPVRRKGPCDGLEVRRTGIFISAGRLSDVATLDALKQMPCPLAELKRSALKPWVSLHKKLVKTTPRRIGEKETPGKTLFDEDDGLRELLIELNDLVYDSLGLTERERVLVSDFVNIRLESNDGKVGRPAVERPKPVELKAYAKRLQTELDEFVGMSSDHRHSVEIIYDAHTGMICVDFVPSKKSAPIVVASVDSNTAAALAKTRKQMQEEIGQWIYFNRDLRLYDDPPVHEEIRKGKNRRRVDIKLASWRTRPRTRFCFEAKCLNKKAGVAAYLGKDGLGQFISGSYAGEETHAGMLAYVQTDDYDIWCGRIEKSLDTKKHKLGRSGQWLVRQVIPSIPYTYQTAHTRPKSLPDIAVLHTLLDCT